MRYTYDPYTVSLETLRQKFDGTTLLSQIIVDATQGALDNLIIVFERFADEFTPDDFREINERKVSSLWLLSYMMARCFDDLETYASLRANIEMFNRFWRRNKGQFKKPDCLVSDENGTSLAWLATAGIANNNTEPYDSIVASCGNDFTQWEVEATPRQGESVGITKAWFLAFGAMTHPKYFCEFWARWGKALPLQHLRLTPSEGEYEGWTFLSLLASSAAENRPMAFLAAWPDLSSIIDDHDLLNKKYSDLSVLYHIVYAAHKGYIPRQIVVDIVKAIDLFDFTAELAKVPKNRKLSILQMWAQWQPSPCVGHLEKLERNFDHMIGQAEAILMTANESEMEALAEMAYQAGSLRSYYELGCFFKNHMCNERRAAVYFAKVQVGNPNYEKAQQKLTEYNLKKHDSNPVSDASDEENHDYQAHAKDLTERLQRLLIQMETLAIQDEDNGFAQGDPLVIGRNHAAVGNATNDTFDNQQSKGERTNPIRQNAL